MITGVNHITLVVADLDRALEFYQGRLGLHLRARARSMAYLEGGSLWLCLETGTPTPRSDDSHIAFTCTTEDIDSLSDLPQWKANRSEGASLYLCDPDGHKLELHVGTLTSRLDHYGTHPPEGLQIF